MKSLKLIIGIFIAALIVLSTAAVFSTTGMGIFDSVSLSLGFALLLTGLEMKLGAYMPKGLAFVGICGKLSGGIAKSCTNPLQAGTRDRMIIINFDDVLAPTYAVDGETVIDIVLMSGTIGYVIDGQNNSIEPKSTMTEQGKFNMWDHEVVAMGFDISPETKLQVNNMKDGRFVIIVENYFRGVGGNSAFEVYGLTTGLEVTELERDANSDETQGAFHFKFATKKNKEPKTANTFYDGAAYASTKVIVDALLV
jgi:hypothetical protein